MVAEPDFRPRFRLFELVVSGGDGVSSSPSTIDTFERWSSVGAGVLRLFVGSLMSKFEASSGCNDA